MGALKAPSRFVLPSTDLAFVLVLMAISWATCSRTSSKVRIAEPLYLGTRAASSTTEAGDVVLLFLEDLSELPPVDSDILMPIIMPAR